MEISLLVCIGLILYFSLDGKLLSDESISYMLGVLLFGLFLITIHTSAFFKLNKDNIIYRKYFIRRKLRFSSIKAILITKYTIDHRFGFYDVHDRNGNLQGYIFLLKEASVSKMVSHNNLAFSHSDWSNINYDMMYRLDVFQKILSGGFCGKLYIVKSLESGIGKEIETTLKEQNFNMERLEIL